MAVNHPNTGVWLGLSLFLAVCVHPSAGSAVSPEKPETEPDVFRDEPEARALYNQMIEAIRKPESLSYKSEYRWEARGDELGHCTYTVWLKKPNYFRVEAVNVDGRGGGTIVGDGKDLWVFWRDDRPCFSIEEREAYEKTRSNVYMKKPAPPGGHSIGHETGLTGAGMSMPVIDPSTFHGYTDSLQPYLDGVMGMGSEYVGDEDCHVIEVSIMKHQRSWYLWLSKKDHLPRKLKQVVRVSYDIIMHEVWSDIVIDGQMPAEKFVWTPPEGWRQWELPKPEDILLKPGTEAPDFELASADGGKIKLSDYREKIVWFYIWRAG